MLRDTRLMVKSCEYAPPRDAKHRYAPVRGEEA
jgi:hypothetical protein